MFEVKKDKHYLLFVYYQGEIAKSDDGHALCEYYSAMIAYNSEARMLKELECLNKSFGGLPS